MPSRRRPDPEPTLSIFPDQVHIGDRITDAEAGDEAQEWVASRPVTFKKGHEVRARVQRPGEPGTSREKYWAAHEKITVRRRTAALSRPTAEIEDDVASRTTSPTSTPCAASSGGCAPRSCASRRTSACSRSASRPVRHRCPWANSVHVDKISGFKTWIRQPSVNARTYVAVVDDALAHESAGTLKPESA